MATGITRLADLIVPQVWYPYFTQLSTKTSALINSGILNRTPEYDEMAGSKGLKFDIPFTRPLTERSSRWRADGGNTTSSEKLVTGQMTTTLLKRRHKLGWNQLAAHISGTTGLYPMGKASWGYSAKIAPGDVPALLAYMMMDLWNEDLQQILITVLNGVFASTTNTPGVTDTAAPGLADLNLNVSIVTGTITSANRISPQTLGSAASLLGDYASRLKTLIVHPTVYYQGMLPDNITPSLQTSSQEWQIPSYLDYQVILDDTLPVDRTLPLYPKYTSYLFTPGSIAYGDYILDALTGAEVSRDPDQTEEFLHTRKAFFIQPLATSYIAAAPADGAGPDDAALGAAANWSRTDSVKNVGIVKIVTNG